MWITKTSLNKRYISQRRNYLLYGFTDIICHYRRFKKVAQTQIRSNYIRCQTYICLPKKRFYGYPKAISNYLISRYSASVNFTPSKRYCSSSMSSLKLSDMDMKSEPKNRTDKKKPKRTFLLKFCRFVLPITEISTCTSRTETKIYRK